MHGFESEKNPRDLNKKEKNRRQEGKERKLTIEAKIIEHFFERKI